MTTQRADFEDFKLPGRAEQPAEPKDKPNLDHRPAPEGTVWLRKWKGRKCKTRKALLAARCQHCGFAYQMSGDLMNTLASKQSSWAVAGALFDLLYLTTNSGGAVSKDAGRQLHYSRAKQTSDESVGAIGAARQATRCPACDSNQVLVESP